MRAHDAAEDVRVADVEVSELAARAVHVLPRIVGLRREAHHLEAPLSLHGAEQVEGVAEVADEGPVVLQDADEGRTHGLEGGLDGVAEASPLGQVQHLGAAPSAGRRAAARLEGGLVGLVGRRVLAQNLAGAELGLLDEPVLADLVAVAHDDAAAAAELRRVLHHGLDHRLNERARRIRGRRRRRDDHRAHASDALRACCDGFVHRRGPGHGARLLARRRRHRRSSSDGLFRPPFSQNLHEHDAPQERRELW
mmetsp:Transcript_20980/g.63919  ORF Transcript_20980/g.63919 Transcript_20980/m.63919 type:complete len:252 (-) Transcript_20980:415-1170(-)